MFEVGFEIIYRHFEQTLRINGGSAGKLAKSANTSNSSHIINKSLLFTNKIYENLFLG